MLLWSLSAWIMLIFGYSFIIEDKFQRRFGGKIFYGIASWTLVSFIASNRMDLRDDTTKFIHDMAST